MNRIILLLILLYISTTLSLQAQWTETSGPEGGDIFTMAITENGGLATIYPDRVYRFDGITWHRIENRPLLKLWSSGDLYFASTFSDGLIRSEDDGNTWRPVGIRGDGLWFADNSASGSLLASEGNVLYESHDSGVEWNTLARFDSLTISRMTASGGTIVIAAWTPSSSSVILRSTDEGATWFDATNGLPKNNTILAMTASDENNIYLGTAQYGLFHSSDRGATWNVLGDLPTDDIGNVTVTDIAVVDDVVWAATPLGTYHYSGTAWEMATSFGGSTFASMPDPTGSTLVIGTTGGIFATDPSGDNLVGVNMGLRAARINGFFGTESGIIAATPFGLFNTSDAGRNWSQISPIESEEFASVGTTIFARTPATRAAGVWRSNDEGQSWRPLMEDGVLPLVEAHDNDFYLGMGTIVYKSTDAGQSWTSLPLGISPEFNISSMSFLNNVLVVTTTRPMFLGDATIMLFRQSASGWVDLSKSIPNDVHFTGFYATGDMVYGGTESSSVWRASIADVIGSPASVEVETPSTGAPLISATPNPFTDGATIRFTLKFGGTSRLVITDQLGRPVATPIDGYLAAGRHTVDLDGSALPSGLLYYSLVANGASTTGTFVKLR